MNKEQQQIFFNNLEEVLKEHQDNYESGAWEDFDLHRRKKNKNKWPTYYWVAAALCLFFLAGVLIIDSKQFLADENKSAKSVSLNNIKKIDTRIKSTTITSLIDPLKKKVSVKIAPEKIDKKLDKDLLKVSLLPSVSDQKITIDGRDNTLNDGRNALAAQPVEKQNPITKRFENNHKLQLLAGAYDSLTNKNVQQAIKSDKFSYTFVVSPAIGNEKLNLGGGVELSYKIGSRFSVNSGLLYASIHSSKTASRVGLSQSQDVSLAVSGLEIPLGLAFENQSGYYAAAGVSALSLMNDKLTYNFFQESVVSESVVLGGQVTEIYKVVSEKKSENKTETLNDFVGFFNFSAGKKQRIGNVNLNIGPFLKIPFNDISSERIKLTQAGIRIGIGF